MSVVSVASGNVKCPLVFRSKLGLKLVIDTHQCHHTIKIVKLKILVKVFP